MTLHHSITVTALNKMDTTPLKDSVSQSIKALTSDDETAIGLAVEICQLFNTKLTNLVLRVRCLTTDRLGTDNWPLLARACIYMYVVEIGAILQQMERLDVEL